MTANYIVANWKQNGSLEHIFNYVQTLQGLVASKGSSSKTKTIICPPYPYLMHLKAQLSGMDIDLGAQDVSIDPSSARTGDVSAEMLIDIGVEYVILGHSERRAYYQENEDILLSKINHALSNTLKVIYCVGETTTEREAGDTNAVLERQIQGIAKAFKSHQDSLNDLLIAYEPRWAIGSGKVPELSEINENCALVQTLAEAAFNTHKMLPILYGGSVTSENAEQILSQKSVQGVLVGGASLKADEFFKIMTA